MQKYEIIGYIHFAAIGSAVLKLLITIIELLQGVICEIHVNSCKGVKGCA